ncbi:S1 RNA-binding domain-containing protein [Streptomyces sp. NPDC002055]|uniref:S1 RNA-binding domain-containing protein n=1 Tax=Streptomyces sp. NPDC002055 TaxID=3154534 RepID=UPI003327CFC2
MREGFSHAVRGLTVGDLEPGQVRRGLVESVTDVGAFVDLGCLHALLSAPNLSWVHFDHPSQVVQPGQEVTVVLMPSVGAVGRR